jgi:tetratricopeptide (TPR) repeat protein
LIVSLKKKLLFSLISVTAFFLALEGVLALVGMQPEAANHDPYVGFSSRIPLMQLSEDGAGGRRLKTAPGKLVWFNEQTFAPSKPAGTRRVFCLGGSTTYGRPYGDLTSYSNWLRQLLPMVDRQTDWEVINAGGVSYASYRVAAVMEELAQYDPDLFIVYSAHNEFLERRTYANMFAQSDLKIGISSVLSSTRTWTAMRKLAGRGGAASKTPDELLPAEVDEVLNHSIGPANYQRDDAWRQKVIHHYQVNLARMAKIARDANAQIVFITPASNEKDCSPFKSELAENLSDDQRDRFRLLEDRGRRAAAANQHQQALTEFVAAQAIDDRNPDLLYQIGGCLAALERYDQSLQAFRQALNEDICPLRAVDEITASIHQVAGELNVPVVDFERRLRGRCRDQFGYEALGDAYFLDHVHPTREVHQQLAVWIIEDLLAHAIIKGSLPEQRDIEAIAEQIEQQIDPSVQGVALRNLAKVLHWSGKFNQAVPRAVEALELIDNDPESLLVLADSLKNLGYPDRALRRYEQLVAAEPFYARAILPFGELLAEQQEYGRAKPFLELAAGISDEGSEKQQRAKYFLGITLAELGEYDRAIPLLEQVRQDYPLETQTIIYLAQAKAAHDQPQAAIELYRQAIDIDPDAAKAHELLGLLLLKQGDIAGAISHLETALQIDPDNQQLQQHLTIARQLQ